MPSDLVNKLKKAKDDSKLSVALDLAQAIAMGDSPDGLGELFKMLDWRMRNIFMHYSLSDQLIAVEALGYTADVKAYSRLVDFYSPKSVGRARWVTTPGKVFGDPPIRVLRRDAVVFYFPNAKGPLKEKLEYMVTSPEFDPDAILDENFEKYGRKLNIEHYEIFLRKSKYHTIFQNSILKLESVLNLNPIVNAVGLDHYVYSPIYYLDLKRNNPDTNQT